MAFKKRRLIQAISDRPPGDEKSLLAAVKKEIWPFLQQVRRMLVDADNSGGTPDGPGGTTVIVNEGDTNITNSTTVISTTITPSQFSDHLVKARTMDPTAVGGLLEKTAGDDGVTCTLKQDADGVERLHIGYIPSVSPADTASTLYPAMIPDPLNGGTVACVFTGPHSARTNTPMMEGFWVEIAPGVIECVVPGPIPAAWLDGVDSDAYNTSGVSAMLGKTVLAYYQGDSSVSGLEEPRQLLWVIDDVGGHRENYGTPHATFISTNARMHLAPAYSVSSAWVQGMTFEVQAGTKFGGKLFTLANAVVTLGTTFIQWTVGSSYTPADQYELLTGPQLVSSGATSDVLELSTTMASGTGGYVEAGFQEGFETLLGTPGVAVIPAGPFTFDIERIRISGGSATSLTMLRVRIYDVDIDDNVVQVLVADSNPIFDVDGVAISFTKTMAAPFTTAADHRLVAVYYLRTNSASPVTLTIRYSSPSRGTRITVPFDMAISGGNDGYHPHQSGRDVADQHPDSAITATPMGDATTDMVMVLMPAAANGAKLAGGRLRAVGGGTFDGIDSTGFVAGQAICVFFDVHAGEVVTLAHAVAPPFGYPASSRFLLTGSPAGGDLVKKTTFKTFRLDTWSTPQGWRET